MGVTRAQKVRLGVFLMVSGLLLISGIIILAGARLGEKRDAYFIRYGEGEVSLNGLDVGSPVKYSGIRVGRVDRIFIDPKDVGVIVVEISLTENTPVAKDSKANLGSMGITGLKFVDLTRGTTRAGLRQPGDDIPAGESGLDALTNQAGEIATKVSRTLDRLNRLIGPETKARIDGILVRTDALLKTVDDTVKENRAPILELHKKLQIVFDKGIALIDSLNAVARRIDEVTQAVGEGAARATGRASRLIRQLTQTRKNLDDTLSAARGLFNVGTDAMGEAGLRSTLKQLNIFLKRGNQVLRASRDNILDSMGYLRETSENMRDFSRRVREDPSLLILGEGRD